LFMVQRCKFSIELKNFPPDLSGEPENPLTLTHLVKPKVNRPIRRIKKRSYILP
jgi:hypothetical protein